MTVCPECGADLWCSVYEVSGFDEYGPDAQVVESVVKVFCKGPVQHSLRHEFWSVEVALRYYRRYFGGATRARRARIAV